MTGGTRFSAAAIGVLAVTALSGCPWTTSDRPTDIAALPECGHNWDSIITALGDTVLASGSGQLSLPGPITRIPEFHDCQRFIVDRDWGFLVDARGSSGTGVPEIQPQPQGRPRPPGIAPGPLRYQGLYAIFAGWDIKARYDSVTANPVRRITVEGITPITTLTAAPDSLFATVVGDRTGARFDRSGWAFVEVYAEGRYTPLGIDQGFSCAYFYVEGAILRAKMVNYGGTEPDCGKPIDPGQVKGMVLEVRRTQHPLHPTVAGAPSVINDYPVVARWDWDQAHVIQYFGVGCGDGWCQVGPGGFTPSGERSDPTDAGPYATANLTRVYHVKGWFDEQALAPPKIANPPTPSTSRGVLYPDPLLDGRPKAAFSGTWIRTARVSLDNPDPGYGDKLNLVPVTSASEGAMNLIELCWDKSGVCPGLPTPAPKCGPDPADPHEMADDKGHWWARITSSKGVRYFCVRRRDHAADLANFPTVRYTDIPLGVAAIDFLLPPGTARWRWRNKDEVIWQSCDAGCCEVELPCPTC